MDELTEIDTPDPLDTGDFEEVDSVSQSDAKEVSKQYDKWVDEQVPKM